MRSYEPAPKDVKWEARGKWVPVLAGLLSAAGCGSIEPVVTHETVTDPAALYMALTLEQRAINLATAAPYQTIQLVATPRDGRDEPMAGLPAPTFRLANEGDATRLQVTPAGLVTALAAGSQIPVIAELVVPGPVRHADTAMITVVSAPPTMLDSLSIEPASPASAMWPMNADRAVFLVSFAGFVPPVVTPLMLDGAGQPIAGMVVEFASLDPRRATVDRWTGKVAPRGPGPVRVVARTTAYGVTKADTALYTVSWSTEVLFGILPGGGFEPTDIRILPGALALFRNDLDDSVDVTFDDPTDVALPPAPLCDFFQIIGVPEVCGAGDMRVPGLKDNVSFNARFRSFPVPGVYTYHSIRTGATGRIMVTTEVPDDLVAP